MFSQWWQVTNPKGEVIKVQGKGEKLLAENLAESGYNFCRGRQIKTSHGNYTPDFDLGFFFVEVKATRSLLAATGVLPLLENGRKDCFRLTSDNSIKKMEWTHTNTKPIVIFLNENPNDSSYMESEDWAKIKTNIPIIYKVDKFMEFLIHNTEMYKNEKLGSRDFIKNLLEDTKFNINPGVVNG